jgi:flavin reductase (DIM6/NTAB) family NADH-FMN oxidoreductase RutF
LLYAQVTQRSRIDKDTLQNLSQTGECVINIASADLLNQMNQTSASLKPDQSEFDFAEIESIASHKVKPLSVKDSPIRYECTLREIMPISDDSIGGTVILLDVQAIYVRDDLYNDGLINQELVDSVGKKCSDYFSFTNKLVEVERP